MVLQTNVNVNEPVQGSNPSPIPEEIIPSSNYQSNQIIEVIIYAYYFFIDSFKPNSTIPDLLLNHPEMQESMDTFRQEFKEILDDTDLTVDTREKKYTDPAACFIEGVIYIHTDKSILYKLLMKNNLLRQFLYDNLRTIHPIMQQWYQDYPPKMAETISKEPPKEFTIFEFINENKNFFIANVLSFIWEKTPELAELYKNVLETLPENSISCDKAILDPFNYGLIKILGDGLCEQFTDLIITNDIDGFNKFLQNNGHINAYLVKNLAKLNPIIEKLTGNSYQRVIKNTCLSNNNSKPGILSSEQLIRINLAIKLTMKSAEFIYALLFFKMSEKAKKRFLSKDEIKHLNEQETLYNIVLAEHKNQKTVDKFYRHLCRKLKATGLSDDFIKAISNISSAKNNEKLQELLKNSTEMTDFLYTDLLTLRGVISCWNENQLPQNTEADAPESFEEKQIIQEPAINKPEAVASSQGNMSGFFEEHTSEDPFFPGANSNQNNNNNNNPQWHRYQFLNAEDSNKTSENRPKEIEVSLKQ